jgi:hypothetical protein
LTLVNIQYRLLALNTYRMCMSIPQWALFISGLGILYVGVGLMAYGALQKRSRAGEDKEHWIAQILNAVSGLVAAFGKYLGANRASKVGLLLVFTGLILIFVPFYVPGLKP